VVGLALPDAPGLDWYAGMSRGNVEEFTEAADGEPRYRPLVERLAAAAVTAVEHGGVHVSEATTCPRTTGERWLRVARKPAT
jgi:hypothetical protein